MSMSASIITQKTGRLIFKEGDKGDSMYIILEGSVDIYAMAEGQEMQLAILRPGDFFGEMSLFRDKPRSASARVLKDVRLAVIQSRQQLERFLVDNPLFAAKMVTIMAGRLSKTNVLLIQKVNELAAIKLEYQTSH